MFFEAIANDKWIAVKSIAKELKLQCRCRITSANTHRPEEILIDFHFDVERWNTVMIFVILHSAPW